MRKAFSKKQSIQKPQCGHLVIFLPLRFYVKSIFGDFEVSKCAILTVLAPLNLGFGEFLLF